VAVRTFHGFVEESALFQRVLKGTAGLAHYSITEGQQVDVPSVHPELRSKAGSFASPDIIPRCSTISSAVASEGWFLSA
jgi:hypothetical protein